MCQPKYKHSQFSIYGILSQPGEPDITTGKNQILAQLNPPPTDEELRDFVEVSRRVYDQMQKGLFLERNGKKYYLVCYDNFKNTATWRYHSDVNPQPATPKQSVADLSRMLDLQKFYNAGLKHRLEQAEAKLESLPADWSKDSSLETWFPLTAKELAETKQQLAEEKKRSFNLATRAGNEPLHPLPGESTLDAAARIYDHLRFTHPGIAKTCVKADRDYVASLEKTLTDIRKIFPQILLALGNGSLCTDDASVEFLSEIPEEVKLRVSRLQNALSAANLKIGTLESKQRTTFCCYCNHTVRYENNEQSKLEAFAEILNHDAVCPKNPLVTKLKDLEVKHQALVTAATVAKEAYFAQRDYPPVTPAMRDLSSALIADGAEPKQEINPK